MSGEPRHTAECVAAREGYVDRDTGLPDPWPAIGELDSGGRAAVLACPHRAHDAARIMCRSEGAGTGEGGGT